MDFLCDRDLAMLTDDEIKDYYTSLTNEGSRIRAAFIKPSSKWWSRIKAYREGKNGDELFPKHREVYAYSNSGRKKVTYYHPKA
jgi:hypothetical protein